VTTTDATPPSPGTSAPPLIAIDFDGTITVEDITNIIWDTHVPFDWRAVLMPPSRAGTVTPLELIANGYREVTVGPEALLAEVRPHARLRAGFEALVAQARARAWPLRVVSHGLDFYLRALLPPGVPFTSFEGTFERTPEAPSDAGRWRVRLPAGFSLPAGRDFKVQVLDQLRAQHPGHRTIYIGDGRLDFPAARQADVVFAVRDSTLARFCRDASVACTEFDTFDQITAALG
jgi:2-hydroxy-3-keto-5-methylthiopentenyl-1-phosphate phosphatase